MSNGLDIALDPWCAKSEVVPSRVPLSMVIVHLVRQSNSFSKPGHMHSSSFTVLSIEDSAQLEVDV